MILSQEIKVLHSLASQSRQWVSSRFSEETLFKNKVEWEETSKTYTYMYTHVHIHIYV